MQSSVCAHAHLHAFALRALRIGAAPLTAASGVTHFISTCFDDVDNMQCFPLFCSAISINIDQDPSSLYHWETSPKCVGKGK